MLRDTTRSLKASRFSNQGGTGSPQRKNRVLGEQAAALERGCEKLARKGHAAGVHAKAAVLVEADFQGGVASAALNKSTRFGVGEAAEDEKRMPTAKAMPEMLLSKLSW